jgi:hypothetical protein
MDIVHQIILHVVVSIHTNIVSDDIIDLILDINECNVNSSLCGNGICINQIGSYTCNCTNGYRFNSQTCIGKFYLIENLQIMYSSFSSLSLKISMNVLNQI